MSECEEELEGFLIDQRQHTLNAVRRESTLQRRVKELEAEVKQLKEEKG